jgi:hypothetical protein
MNLIRRYFAGLLLGSVLLVTGCQPTSPGPGSLDTTPPGFVQVLVGLEVTGDPNSRGEFDITSQDVSKDMIPANYVIHIKATAGDSESGITGISLESRTVNDGQGETKDSNLTWKCAAGAQPGSILVSTLEAGLLPITLAAPPSPAPSLWQIDAVVDPVAATGCAVDTSIGVGPISLGGFIRLKVTNGAGLSSASKTFIFDYADIGTGR